MTVQDRRQREREQTRGKIMDAARRLFAAEGFEAVSMRRIADAIDYSPTAIYVHFKDKQDLFNAICTEDFRWLAEFIRDIAAIADPVERMRKLGIAYCRFAIQYPNHYRLMFMTRLDAAALRKSSEGEKGNPDFDAWEVCRAATFALADEGWLRPEVRGAELAAQTFWAGVHGVASLQIAKGEDPWIDWTPIEQRIAAMTDTLIRGLCVDKPPGRKRGAK